MLCVQSKKYGSLLSGKTSALAHQLCTVCQALEEPFKHVCCHARFGQPHFGSSDAGSTIISVYALLLSLGKSPQQAQRKWGRSQFLALYVQKLRTVLESVAGQPGFKRRKLQRLD